MTRTLFPYLITDFCGSVDERTGEFCDRFAGHRGMCQVLWANSCAVWDAPTDEDDLQAQLTYAENELAGADQTIRELRNERRDLTDECDGLRRERDGFAEDVDRLTDEVERLTEVLNEAGVSV